ncbi:MAG TPA: hypothetical protein VK812_13280 [Candidatus Binatus sp.]|jgi:hypothetical protein|nr:hypothetical protein [Candidatus Binatus sp.]
MKTTANLTMSFTPGQARRIEKAAKSSGYEDSVRFGREFLLRMVNLVLRSAAAEASAHGSRRSPR